MSKSAAATTWTPANTVTVIRIIGVPFLVLAMLAPWDGLFGNAQLAASIKPWVCAVLFLLLSFSDFLDGYLARSRNEVTTFGKFMDPLADKLLVIAVFLVMVQMGQLPAWVDAVGNFQDDKDGYESLFKNLKSSKYDVNAKGDHAVTLTTTDSDGNVSDPVSVTVHVK